MADKKISALSAASTPLAGTEVLPIVQSGTTVKVSVANLTDGRDVTANSIGIGTTPSAPIHASSAVAPTSSPILRIDSTATTNYSAGNYVGGQIRLNYTNALSRYSGINFSNNGATSQEFFGVVQDASGYGTFVWQGFYGGFSQRMSLSAPGDLTLNYGNFVQGTAAKGVNFTANTPAAGMTSQLLNWYEEGTWTPTIAFSGASTGITYSTQTGLYTRIGRVVYVEAIITLSNKGSSTGDATIRGLPFTIGGTYAPAVVRPNTITYTGQTVAYFEPTVAYVVLSQVTEAGVVSALTNTNFANTSQIMVSGFYFV